MAFLLSTDEYDVCIRLIAFAANLLKYSLEHSFPYLTMSDSDVPGQDSADEASVQERSSDHEREGTARLGLLDRHDDGVDDEVEDSDEEDEDNAGGTPPVRSLLTLGLPICKSCDFLPIPSLTSCPKSTLTLSGKKPSSHFVPGLV